MSASVFDQAFAVVVGAEGGFGAEPADPGNWTGGRVGAGRLVGTAWGISAASYPDLDLSRLTLEAARTIYRRDYWDRVSGDALPPALALMMFDAAINNGVARAGTWLQLAAGAKPDGRVGPATLAAVAAAAQRLGGAGLCAEFLARRLAFMGGLPTWDRFGLGWARRICALPFHAMRMEPPT